MRTVTEKRADELVKGDRLDIGGQVWTVAKAKRKGKRVRLAIEGRRGSFSEDVKAKARYTLATERGGVSPTTDPPRRTGASRRAPAPLLDAQGAMTRWAKPRDLTAPAEPRKADPWEHVPKSDRPLIEELGAKLVGVEVEGGKLIVPPVTDATIFGHLLTMHGRRFDGATMAEAKAWARENDAAGTKTAEQVLSVLDFEKAYALHDDLHRDLTAMPRPHWHREKAPR